MKKVIVTGANGFIGTHLVHELVHSGYAVTAIVKENTPTTLIEGDNVDIVVCDLSDLASLAEKINMGYECFYHLAWIGSAGPARVDYSLQLSNVQYTCAAVEVAKKLGCQRFVGAGSIMEDESNVYVPCNASKPGGGYIYSTAKLTAHYMAKCHANTLGIEFCWGKISNAYGRGDTTGRFMHYLIGKLLRGEDCDLTSGTQLYDFIYVTEVARAFRYIGERGKTNNSYYIGSLQPQPLRKFVTEARNIISPNVNLNFGVVDFNGIEMDRCYFNALPLKEDTEFENSISFKEGIVQYADWLRRLENI